MVEIDFNFIVAHLEDEIKRLGETEGSMVKDAVNAGMAEYLRHLLGWMETAVKVERDRVQGAKDAIDATLYALMSTGLRERWFSADFAKGLGKAERDIDADEGQKKPKRGEEGVFDCRRMADRLEALRLRLKSRMAKDVTQKVQFVRDDCLLQKASAICNAMADEWKRGR